MTRDDILRMAREAGLLMHADAKDAYIRDGVYAEQLERFYALAVAKEREARQDAQSRCEELKARIVKAGVEQRRAVMDEREACAKIAADTVCATHIPTGIKIYGTRAADAIRARSAQ